MNYKFNSCSINDSEIEMAKKVSELFTKFRNDLNNIKLSIDELTVSYRSDNGYKRYLTLS